MKNDNDFEIRHLYQKLILAWNERDAAKFTSYFLENSNVVGFDGSQLNGQSEILATLENIFSEHPTAPYVTIVKEIRMLSTHVGLLRSIVGMIPVGQTKISPAVNAVHTLVSVKEGDHWKISVFQNTPAAFHGRPEIVQKMTAELQLEFNSVRSDMN